MTRIHIAARLASGLLLVGAAETACAQLTLRLDPELDDPGTSSMPARFGYTKSKKGSGATTQFALSYQVTKASAGANVVYEPYVALVVNDNPAIATDRKSAEVGLKSVVGDVTQGVAWLVDASGSRSRDRVAGASSAEGKLTVEPVSAWLKHGLGYTSGRWGLFLRPKLSVYFVKTLETEDATTSPMGKTTGASADLAVDLFLPMLSRAKFTFVGTYARDYSVSGDRKKDDYKKAKFQAEYALYDVTSPPKGKALFSLVFERSIGRDAMSTSPQKKASTGLYLGLKM